MHTHTSMSHWMWLVVHLVLSDRRASLCRWPNRISCYCGRLHQMRLQATDYFNAGWAFVGGINPKQWATVAIFSLFCLFCAFSGLKTNTLCSFLCLFVALLPQFLNIIRNDWERMSHQEKKWNRAFPNSVHVQWTHQHTTCALGGAAQFLFSFSFSVHLIVVVVVVVHKTKSTVNHSFIFINVKYSIAVYWAASSSSSSLSTAKAMAAVVFYWNENKSHTKSKNG